MTTAIIADDEPYMRESLRELLLSLWPQLEVIAEAEDGPSALVKIESLRPDICFLDIRMPGLTGLQVAKSITVPTQIVFVTAFDSHAVEAFEANAVDYVVKPVDPVRLAKVVSKLRKATDTSKQTSLEQMLSALQTMALELSDASAVKQVPSKKLEWLQVSVGTQIRMVHIDDVCFFESDSKYTRVVADGCDGLIRVSLKELMEQLGDGEFIQTHRSTLVNRRFVHAVHRKGDVIEVEIKGLNERLKVSNANHHLFRAM
jgi:DNA-binding LytR/AlgR family response regulator